MPVVLVPCDAALCTLHMFAAMLLPLAVLLVLVLVLVFKSGPRERRTGSWSSGRCA